MGIALHALIRAVLLVISLPLCSAKRKVEILVVGPKTKSRLTKHFESDSTESSKKVRVGGNDYKVKLTKDSDSQVDAVVIVVDHTKLDAEEAAEKAQKYIDKVDDDDVPMYIIGNFKKELSKYKTEDAEKDLTAALDDEGIPCMISSGKGDCDIVHTLESIVKEVIESMTKDSSSSDSQDRRKSRSSRGSIDGYGDRYNDRYDPYYGSDRRERSRRPERRYDDFSDFRRSDWRGSRSSKPRRKKSSKDRRGKSRVKTTKNTRESSEDDDDDSCCKEHCFVLSAIVLILCCYAFNVYQRSMMAQSAGCF